MCMVAAALADQNAAAALDDCRHHNCHWNSSFLHGTYGLSHDDACGESMYSELLLEHFRNPQNVGDLDPPAVTVEVTNPACGDILRLAARFEQDRVSEARYRTRGCTASIAAGSALTQ